MHEQLETLESMAPGLIGHLSDVNGVEGVVLGGSRARGAHSPSSDFDLGIYYRSPLDTAAVQAIATRYSEVDSHATEPGGWGPWMDGGAWLTIQGVQVDFIYRNVDRVESVWIDCQQGRFSNEIQAGHPLGFWSHTYAGELALAVPAAELSDELAELKSAVAVYPDALSDSLVAALWEATFSTVIARKAIDRLDVAYVAGCLFRAAGVTAHALHGHGRQWLLNEKGAMKSSAKMPAAPDNFETRVAAAFQALGPDRLSLESACRIMDDLVNEAAKRTAR